MKLGVIGVGLIGGSFASGLKRFIPDLEVLGSDKNPENVFKALEIGVIDRISDLNTLCRQADVMILSIPVDAIKAVLPRVLDQVSSAQLVVDFGSTKKAICEAVQDHPKRASFLAAHPIAGTEYSGPQAALANLFDQKVMITCEEDKTESSLKEIFHNLCGHFDMTMKQMTPEAHDLHMAFVSHLSHITSFALSNTVLDKKSSEDHIFDMAGSGFASTVRLAKSSPDMWAPIFEENKEHLIEGLHSYIAQLESFKKSLESEDKAALKAFMSKANQIKEIVDRLP